MEVGGTPSSVVTMLDGSTARHRKVVPASSIVLVASSSTERTRFAQVLRKAGHTIHLAVDHEQALDLTAELRPHLLLIASDDRGEVINTLKHLRVMRCGWDAEVKTLVVGDISSQVYDELSIPSLPSQSDLLKAVEAVLVRTDFDHRPEAPGAVDLASVTITEHQVEVADNLGLDFLREYIETSFKDIANQADRLQQDLSNKDIASIRANLHSMHGLAMNVGCLDLASFCRSWRTGDEDAIHETLPALIQAIRDSIPKARVNFARLLTDSIANGTLSSYRGSDHEFGQ